MGFTSRILNAKNWKYAAREISLIVIGILVALAINNWNEERINYQEETKTLQELRAALENDLSDIRINVRYQEQGLASSQTILKHIHNDIPYHDSLNAHFGQMLSATFFLSDNMVYRSLEVSGRALISSNTIRKAASVLYAHDYAFIKQLEQIDNELLNSFFRPYYGRHFYDHRMFVSSTPRDPSFVLNDPVFEGNLEWWISGKKMIVPRYNNLAGKVEDLIAKLDQELAGR